jgi:hypothetical protein
MGDARLSVGSCVPGKKTVIEISAVGNLRLGNRFSWHFEARMVAQAGMPEKPCASSGREPCYSGAIRSRKSRGA